MLAFIEGWPYIRGAFVLKRVHMGHNEVSLIERKGVPISGVAFTRGFTTNYTLN